MCCQRGEWLTYADWRWGTGPGLSAIVAANVSGCCTSRGRTRLAVIVRKTRLLQLLLLLLLLARLPGVPRRHLLLRVRLRPSARLVRGESRSAGRVAGSPCEIGPVRHGISHV